MKLTPTMVLMAIFLALPVSVIAEPLEIIGSFSAHPVMLAGEPRVVDGIGDVGAKLEVVMNQNVLDPDIGMILYSGNPVSSGPVGMAPLGRYVAVVMSPEAESSLRSMTLSMPYSVSELRNADVNATSLVMMYWDENIGEWSSLKTEVTDTTDWSGMLKATASSPGLFSIYGRLPETPAKNDRVPEKNCTTNTSCSDWSGCIDGWRERICHELDTCSGNKIDVIENEECELASVDDNNPISGMLTGKSDVLFVFAVLALVLVFAAVIEITGMRKGK